MTVSGVNCGAKNGKVELNDWWKEGWEDRSPRKQSQSIFTGKIDNTVALNDWWGEGWTKNPTV